MGCSSKPGWIAAAEINRIQARRLMSDKNTAPHSLTVHPVYGAIYQDGEYVQRGAVLGLSVDSRQVVVAPVSGWVRLSGDGDSARGIAVEIWQHLRRDGAEPAEADGRG
jgi:hypothetical protein